MNTWKLSWHGIRTVTLLDLRQRVRSRRWIVALVAWFVLIVGVSASIVVALEWTNRREGADIDTGVISFGIAAYFILAMSLVIAPTFTATSINGDRANGTLALLQASRLSAAEVAMGKLLAAWLTAGMFLAVALPFIIWALVIGSIPLWQVVVCFAVMFCEVAVVCAIGLGMSALFNRPAASTVLTYLVVALLTVLSPMFLGIASAFTMGRDTVRVWTLPPAVEAEYYDTIDEYWMANPDGNGEGIPAPPFGECTWQTEEQMRPHMDRVWWLIALNPFVIVADAAPLPGWAQGDLMTYLNETGDPLIGLKAVVRELRVPEPSEYDYCLQLYSYNPAYTVNYDTNGNVVSVKTADGTPVPVTSPVTRPPLTAEDPLWPWGLGISVLIAAGFFWVAVRRLSVPYGKLPTGTRVA